MMTAIEVVRNRNTAYRYCAHEKLDLVSLVSYGVILRAGSDDPEHMERKSQVRSWT